MSELLKNFPDIICSKTLSLIAILVIADYWLINENDAAHDPAFLKLGLSDTAETPGHRRAIVFTNLTVTPVKTYKDAVPLGAPIVVPPDDWDDHELAALGLIHYLVVTLSEKKYILSIKCSIKSIGYTC